MKTRVLKRRRSRNEMAVSARKKALVRRSKNEYRAYMNRHKAAMSILAEINRSEIRSVQATTNRILQESH